MNRRPRSPNRAKGDAAQPAPQRAASPENLATLALFIANDVNSVLAASYVTYLASIWFERYSQEDRCKVFRMHPANTLTYRALQALEERAIVTIYEYLADEMKLHPHRTKLRSKADLRLHRLALSHPATVRWRDAKMTAFDRSGRKYTDFKAAQVWDLQRTINEELRAHNLKTYNEELPVSYEMGCSLHTILDLSRQPEVAVPSSLELYERMRIESAKYRALLESHPDGARNVEKEEERAARWNAMVDKLKSKAVSEK